MTTIKPDQSSDRTLVVGVAGIVLLVLTLFVGLAFEASGRSSNERAPNLRWSHVPLTWL